MAGRRALDAALPIWKEASDRRHEPTEADAAARTDAVQLPDAAEHERAGTSYYLSGEQPIELPGLSCFLRVGERVFHTYSTYARGSEVGGSNDLLDLTALGRQEPWEEPEGRTTGLGLQAGNPTLRYLDEYPDA